jgi:tetratricopeptide (TPR) repeat protein
LGDSLEDIAKHRKIAPNQLRKAIQGELDWIILKALEKDRTRRYESANELALDIQRHLSDEPVVAGPPSKLYCCYKFVRRNRILIAAAAAVAAALIAGLVLATVGFVKASQQRHFAEKQYQRAEVNFRKAREAVDQMLTQVAEELPRLPGMPKQVDSPQVAQIKQALLEDALEYYEGFLEERSTDPLVRYETANAYLRVGDITRLMRLYERAEETYLASVNLLEELTAEFVNEKNYHGELGRAYFNQGELLREVGRLKEVKNAFREAGASYSKAIELDPGDSSYWQWRGKAYWELRQGEKALADLSKAISLNSHNSWNWGVRGNIYFDTEQWDEAIADYSKAVELEPNQSHFWHMRGVCYLRLGETNKALDEYTQAIKLEPNQSHFWHMRGVCYLELGMPDKAVADYTKALELNPDGERGHYWTQRGGAYLQLGQYEKAHLDIARSDEITPDDSHTLYCSALAYLAEDDIKGYQNICAKLLNQTELTEKLKTNYIHWVVWTCVLAPNSVKDSEKIIELAELATEKGSETDWGYCKLGATLYRAGYFDKTVEQLTELSNKWERVEQQYPTNTSPAYTWFFLAMAHHQLGNSNEAKAWFDKASKQSQEELQSAIIWNRELTLKLFREEAAQLLGVRQPASSKVRDME